jgi:hypothetical protein
VVVRLFVKTRPSRTLGVIEQKAAGKGGLSNCDCKNMGAWQEQFQSGNREKRILSGEQQTSPLVAYLLGWIKEDSHPNLCPQSTYLVCETNNKKPLKTQLLQPKAVAKS